MMRALELTSDSPEVSDLVRRYNEARESEDSGARFQELVDEIDAMIDHATWDPYQAELELILGFCLMSLGQLALNSAAAYAAEGSYEFVTATDALNGLE